MGEIFHSKQAIHDAGLNRHPARRGFHGYFRISPARDILGLISFTVTECLVPFGAQILLQHIKADYYLHDCFLLWTIQKAVP
jgi:hypothetical protein